MIVAHDDDVEFMVRIAAAPNKAVTVEFSPVAQISVVGQDDAGRFAKTCELRDIHGLN